MQRYVRALLRVGGASAIALTIACAEPPSKEMNQAQGAIDAARAAGADRYAPTELDAAVTALAASEQAASVRDYRLALNHALDSRERAQNAAVATVEARAKARGDAERALAEVEALHARARTRQRDPEVRALPARSTREATTTIAAVEIALQEARSALGAEDYPRVIRLLDGRAAALESALIALDDAAAAPPSRRRRPPSARGMVDAGCNARHVTAAAGCEKFLYEGAWGAATHR